jgi:hypothetical protein
MNLNTFQLRLTPFGSTEFSQVRVLIDGDDLIDLVRAVELPWARAEGHETLAGGYSGLAPDQWRELPEQYEDGRAAVLACDCGEVGCWPLRVRITLEDETVTWSDFQQPHRDWSYPGLGPFCFNRQQYEQEITRIAGAAA